MGESAEPTPPPGGTADKAPADKVPAWRTFLTQYAAPAVVASLIGAAVSVYTAIGTAQEKQREYNTKFQERPARTRECAIIALALVLALTALARADGNTGMIYGKVLVRGTHQPVCTVTVTAESDREPDLHTHTWRDGSFTFLSVSPGRVKVVVGRSRSTGYVNVSANLETHAGMFSIPREECARSASGISFHRR